MDILESLYQTRLISSSQWDVLKNGKVERWKKSAWVNGMHALSAMYEGILWYHKAYQLVQDVITQKSENLLVQQSIPGEMWKHVKARTEQLTKTESLPLLDGRYLVPDRPIGKGGYASVYRCLDVKIKREVAIKKIFRKDAVSQSRFALEMKALCRLSHPHIVSILDIIAQEQCDCLVMEYLEGGDLQNRLDAGEIPSDVVVSILLQILYAISYCNSQGIIHRDLKPSNILFSNGKHCKVSDFGLIKELNAPYPGLTCEGKILGTLGYIAPEVMLGGSITSAVDVYGAGMIGFYGLYGYHPFFYNGSTMEEVRTACLQEVKIPSSSPVDKKLGKIISKAIHPDPAQRISIQALIEDLEKYRGIKEMEATGDILAPVRSPRKKILGVF